MKCPHCGSDDVAMLGFGANWKCYSCFEISADSEMVGTSEDKAMSEKTKTALIAMAKHVATRTNGDEGAADEGKS